MQPFNQWLIRFQLFCLHIADVSHVVRILRVWFDVDLDVVFIFLLRLRSLSLTQCVTAFCGHSSAFRAGWKRFMFTTRASSLFATVSSFIQISLFEPQLGLFFGYALLSQVVTTLRIISVMPFIVESELSKGSSRNGWCIVHVSRESVTITNRACAYEFLTEEYLCVLISNSYTVHCNF